MQRGTNGLAVAMEDSMRQLKVHDALAQFRAKSEAFKAFKARMLQFVFKDSLRCPFKAGSRSRPVEMICF